MIIDKGNTIKCNDNSISLISISFFDNNNDYQ